MQKASLLLRCTKDYCWLSMWQFTDPDKRNREVLSMIKRLFSSVMVEILFYGFKKSKVANWTLQTTLFSVLHEQKAHKNSAYSQRRNEFMVTERHHIDTRENV